ncbi:MAG: metal-sulfur cluster assembly factor [Gemmatimonadetes bacterium]|nr:metal-sulfur cluster assembly factor [Gemmatimonadota bacterium]MCB9505814.1 metal-sulfur cluster assembly factor [Gemmatimonadales bacterium]MCA9763631.1 metal-sulfur cluster assembly factor [Gemmatimonadota bacterium]MCB9517642.1 metal-sulfur cluster assembly factor [Gemmatimonadales bacterium]HPF61627.1 metal-sulfur cluster assembly factor [Gemmatimonadales bacterium]
MDTPLSPPSPELARKALRAVKDPELGLNIIDIGLIYEVEVSETGRVDVKMTLTSPGCPAGTEIMDDVRETLMDLEGVTEVEIALVWEPYWTPDRMDPRVRAFLGH